MNEGRSGNKTRYFEAAGTLLTTTKRGTRRTTGARARMMQRS
jgi:hypothetical protein